MPSPFPGMDPYLEGELWTTFHTQFAVEIAHQISPSLAPKYVAFTEKRFEVYAPPESSLELEALIPDVGIAATEYSSAPGTSAALVEAPLELATVMPEEQAHVWIEIRDVDQRRLVTVIEFLSPSNKHGEGREQYLEKRCAVLSSRSHLIEIDLLRAGKRLPMKKPLPKAPYFVLLGQVSKRPILQVWPMSLRQPLPKIPIPLLSGDADVSVDLQQAFNKVYDGFNYRYVINYRKPAQPPLTPSDETWADELLRAVGKRP